VSLTLAANLLPWSLTQVANFAAGINDTSGIGGKLAPVLLIQVANLPTV
jgi:hypothetical protein